MNLQEFKNKIDFLYATETNPERVRVVITTYEGNTAGTRPWCDIEGLHLGFDWENGQLRLEPKSKLTKWNKDV